METQGKDGGVGMTTMVSTRCKTPHVVGRWNSPGELTDNGPAMEQEEEEGVYVCYWGSIISRSSMRWRV